MAAPERARAFGAALASDGLRVLVGAPATDDGAGAAWLVTDAAERVVTGARPGDEAGAAVALGESWFVGIPHAGERLETAGVRLGTGAVASEDGQLIGDEAGDCFGASLAWKADRGLLVGAPCRGSVAFEHPSLPRPSFADGPGAALLYSGGERRASFEGAELRDRLGHSVAWLGDTAVLGAPDRFGGDLVNQEAQGRVHLFRAPGDGTFSPASADSTLAGGRGTRQLHDEHGWSLATGDIDQDGRDDLFVGAPELDDFQRQGGGWIFSDPWTGASYGWDAEIALAGEPQSGISARAGSAAVIADLNCDGAPDLAVGAPLRRTDAERAGAVYVAFGPLSSWTPLASTGVVLSGRGLGTRAGTALAAADRDGDGCTDLLIGAPGAEDGRGAIYVVSLGP